MEQHLKPANKIVQLDFELLKSSLTEQAATVPVGRRIRLGTVTMRFGAYLIRTSDFGASEPLASCSPSEPAQHVPEKCSDLAPKRRAYLRLKSPNMRLDSWQTTEMSNVSGPS